MLAELLEQSMASHTQALRAKAPEKWELYKLAWDLRLQAHDLDPEHSHEAWNTEERHTPVHVKNHDTLLAFYEHLESMGRFPVAVMKAKKRASLSEWEFAAPAERKLPINDAAHVRAAASRLNQTQGIDKAAAAKKIAAAEKKLGIGKGKK